MPCEHRQPLWTLSIFWWCLNRTSCILALADKPYKFSVQLFALYRNLEVCMVNLHHRELRDASMFTESALCRVIQRYHQVYKILQVPQDNKLPSVITRRKKKWRKKEKSLSIFKPLPSARDICRNCQSLNQVPGLQPHSQEWVSVCVLTNSNTENLWLCGPKNTATKKLDKMREINLYKIVSVIQLRSPRADALATPRSTTQVLLK